MSPVYIIREFGKVVAASADRGDALELAQALADDRERDNRGATIHLVVEAWYGVEHYWREDIHIYGRKG